MKISFFTSQVWLRVPINREGFSCYSKTERIQAIALDLLKRFPGYVISWLVVSPFLDSWKTRYYFALIGAGCLAVEGLSRLIAHADQIEHERTEDPSERTLLKYHEHLAYAISKFVYAFFHLMTFQITLHEMGHAIVSRALFDGPLPKIEVFFFSGVTTSFTNTLSSLGKKIGLENSILARAAAGIAFETFYTLGLIFFAHYSKDPDQANDLHVRVITNVFSGAKYAASALWQTKNGHDFVSIFTHGRIHPIISMVMIVAIPVLFKAALMGLDHLTDKWSIHQRPPIPRQYA